MKVWAIVQLRDEQLNLPEFFEQYNQLVDGYFIYDDGSCDATPRLCKEQSKVIQVYSAPINREKYHEGNRLNRLLDMVSQVAQEGDWILKPDADWSLIQDCKNNIGKSPANDWLNYSKFRNFLETTDATHLQMKYYTEWEPGSVRVDKSYGGGQMLLFGFKWFKDAYFNNVVVHDVFPHYKTHPVVIYNIYQQKCFVLHTGPVNAKLRRIKYENYSKLQPEMEADFRKYIDDCNTYKMISITQLIDTIKSEKKEEFAFRV